MDVMESSFALQVFLLFILLNGISCTNSPPILSSSKHWTVYEDDEVGTVISTLRARDTEGDSVTFSLESQRPDQDIHTYFKISKNQRVEVAKPLSGLTHGQDKVNYILRVRMDDGSTSPVTEVRLEVLQSSSHEEVSPTRGGDERGVNPILGFNPFGSGSSFPAHFGGGSHPANVFPTNVNSEPSSNVYHIPQNNEPAPPLLQIDSKQWTVRDDTPIGTIIQKVSVLDVSGISYNLSIEDSNGLLIIDQSGNVQVASSLKNQVGNLIIRIRVTTKYDAFDEPVQFTILNSSSSSNPTATPTAVTYPPTTITTITTIPSTVKIRPTRPNTVHNLGNNSQDLRVIGSNAGGSKTVDGASSGSAPEEPTEAPEADVSLTIIPIVLVAGISPIAIGLYCYWRRLQRRKARAEAKESAVVYTEKAEEAIATTQVTPQWGISENDQANNSSKKRKGFAAIFHQRAPSNKYEDDVNTGEGKKNRKLSEISAPLRDTWEFPRHHLKFLSILGEGCFGQVWKCEALNLSPKGKMLVAVKTLKESAGDRERRDLVQELKVLKNLGKHINVVSLLGCCTEKDPIFIILEYMIGGKLQSYLRGSRTDTSYNNLHGASSSLTPKDLILFAYQIARGMEFLARNGIIHRDLAARNVLVGEDKICKVADFGFARDVANNRIYERKSDGRLPIRWMAPESLFDNIFTTKSDVWSFGVLLWEIVTLGSTPYPGYGAAEVMKKVKEGYRLEKPDHCRREVYNIMYYCWDKIPNERPSFTELVHTLENLLLLEVEYIELDRFPDHAYYNVITEKNDELL